jgi:hypothetical protein
MNKVRTAAKRHIRHCMSLAAISAAVLAGAFQAMPVRAEDKADFIVDELSLLLKPLDESTKLASTPIEELLKQAEANKSENASSSEAWFACARVRFWYVDTLNALEGFQQWKIVRRELEQAVQLDSTNSFAVAYLGFLYSTVPSWPLSFGDSEKGIELLEQAMELDGKLAGSHYLYSLLLFSQDHYERSKEHLVLARKNLEEPHSMTPNEKLLIQDELELLSTKLQGQLP